MSEDKKPQGFSALSTERRREIASMGGRAAHAKGTAHKWTKEEAAAAGKVGGTRAHTNGKAHKFNKEEAAAAGSQPKRSRKKGVDANV
jgi:general stress protein YciG